MVRGRWVTVTPAPLSVAVVLEVVAGVVGRCFVRRSL